MDRPLSARGAAALLLATLAGCGRDGSPPPRPNVLLIVTDTVRADKLGCYGDTRGLTPYLDQLAAEGVRFEEAASHAPWTLPSIASLLTSLHPAEHGAGGRLNKLVPDFHRLDPAVTTLAGCLGQAGYATHAIGNVAFLDSWTGLLREFESVDVEAPESNVEVRDALRTTDAALAWLDGHADGRPFFLFVHYFDAHAVYAPPQPFRRRFAGPLDRDDESWVFGTRTEMIALRNGMLDLSPPIVRRAEKLYDGEIAFVDSQIGRLLGGIQQRALTHTLVVVTSDHGEEFLDHGGFEHGHTLYDELTRVPLILHGPGLEPAVVRPRVAHVDVAPTICALAGVDPPAQFVGGDLLEYLVHPERPSRAVLAHGNMWAAPLTSWKSGDEKLIELPDGRVELYDLAADPREARDVAGERPARVAAMRAELEHARAGLRALRQGGAAELDDAARRELAGLGYGGAQGEPGEDDGEDDGEDEAADGGDRARDGKSSDE